MTGSLGRADDLLLELFGTNTTTFDISRRWIAENGGALVWYHLHQLVDGGFVAFSPGGNQVRLTYFGQQRLSSLVRDRVPAPT